MRTKIINFIHTNDDKTTKEIIPFKRVSAWIPIEYKPVIARHPLFYYSDEGILAYFKYKGKMYAINQFIRFNYCFGGTYEATDNGENISLVAYETGEYYKPYHIELSKDCECVRLYEEVGDTLTVKA